jgi:hypothetical protein
MAQLAGIAILTKRTLPDAKALRPLHSVSNTYAVG